MEDKRNLSTLIERTIEALENARMPLNIPGAQNINAQAQQLITQLKNRVLPRLRNPEVPAIVVLGGSSGAGKSTLFNSFVGQEISPASVLRPTTRTPVIAMHPDDVAHMAGHAVLELGDVHVLDSAIPGVVLVDAPDLDSVDEENRALSRTLLDCADLWLFVTTANRYGDAIAWSVVLDAYNRGLTVAIILNRVRDSALETVRRDLVQRMGQEGMKDAPLLVVSDNGPTEGLLPADIIREPYGWLRSISNSHFGHALIQRSNSLMMPRLATHLEIISQAVDMQASAVEQLKKIVHDISEQTLAKLQEHAEQGGYGSGAPTTTWLSVASSGGPLADIQPAKSAKFRRRGGLARRDTSATLVFDSVRAAIHLALTQALELLVQEIYQAWTIQDVNVPELASRARDAVNVEEISHEALRAWMGDIKTLVANKDGKGWFGVAGMASVLGAGAGGVAGAVKIAVALCSDATLEMARSNLAQRCAEACGRVVDTYCEQLVDVTLGSGRTLRLRAVDFKDRF
ncbi:GTPase [Actinotignum urinale]|uniref:GTPase n=1 Tax=Actinotignum urinale TaxID=190146 RepID=A0AAW9HPI1_9ACTO|nr:GTPase [Actinotignum urinale]MDY5155596.1 GTPase [Actinotignum urinale]